VTGPEPLDLSLAGRLLVATPGLRDPHFARAVVLVLDHDVEGAVGVVLNHPLDVPVHHVLPAWSQAAPPAVLFSGGPVEQEGALGVAVAKQATQPDGFRLVRGRLGLLDLDADPTLSLAGLEGLRVFAGYAGWGSGQLEDELGEGSWYIVDSLPDDLLSELPEELWRSVLRRQGGDLAMVSTWTEDPELN
jgi:putative transcriptional regulator